MKVRDVYITNPAKNVNNHSDYINYIDTSSVNQGRLDNVQYLLNGEYPSRAQRKIEDGDILYSSVRPNLRHYYLYKDSLEHPVASTGFVLLRQYNFEYDNKFCYYYLSTDSIVTHLSNIAELSQATFPSCSSKDIENIILPNFTLNKQRRIASILSAYDNLIENNNKRIRLLEQMAENLYKEWFVRFRFPGHEKVEFENGLPKEWSIMKLGVFIKFERGVGYGSKDIEDGENVLLSMNNIRPYGGFIRDYSRPYSGKYKEFQKVRKGDLIMSITDMTQDRRIIGYTGIVPPGKDNRIICTHLIKLSSEIFHTYFLNGLFNYSNLSRIIAERATGANVLGLTADILKGVKTLLPPTELQSMYVTKVTPIIEECFSLQDVNDNLARQRDLLLPRLMSGKLEVNEP